MHRFLLFIFLSFVLSSCYDDEPTDGQIPSGTFEAYVPIYGSIAESQSITISDSKPIRNPGKIFTYNDLLIVNILGEGFHVIDNSYPASPQNLFFINVPGNHDVAIKDGVIYANNYSDIIAFTINQDQELNILKRLDNAMHNGLIPPESGVYFECVDPEKGVVIGWEKREVEDPKCFKP